jgi:hypothetical protein
MLRGSMKGSSDKHPMLVLMENAEAFGRLTKASRVEFWVGDTVYVWLPEVRSSPTKRS